MRLILLSSAAAVMLMAAPQLASAQAAVADVPVAAEAPSGKTPAQNPDPVGASTEASSTTAAASDASTAEAAIPLSSPTPVDQQSSLTASSPSVVSNGPVADTPENRTKYGMPMSNAGKRTAARGN